MRRRSQPKPKPRFADHGDAQRAIARVEHLERSYKELVDAVYGYAGSAPYSDDDLFKILNLARRGALVLNQRWMPEQRQREILAAPDIEELAALVLTALDSSSSKP